MLTRIQMNTQTLEQACKQKLAFIGEENQSQQLSPEEAGWLEVENWDDASQTEEGDVQ